MTYTNRVVDCKIKNIQLQHITDPPPIPCWAILYILREGACYDNNLISKFLYLYFILGENSEIK